jgi:hypothetical protein
MVSAWPAASYGDWRATCDTLHAHTQVLGKLAAGLAPPEPELQHAALRLTARGWETAALPAPDGSGALVAALDLNRHEAVIEHSAGRTERIALTPNRAVGEVTRQVLAAVLALGGPVTIDPAPQEVSWTVPLDQDEEHKYYDPDEVARYFADPPSQDFIMRNAMDAQEVAVGWWPGDARYPRAAFYAYAHPSPAGFAGVSLPPSASRWDAALGEYILDWDDVRAATDPRAMALQFARAAFQHACEVCGWDTDLAASAQGTPPPVR